MATANFASATIWAGDNLTVMRGMNSACVDLIYLDPPFNDNDGRSPYRRGDMASSNPLARHPASATRFQGTHWLPLSSTSGMATLLNRTTLEGLAANSGGITSRLCVRTISISPC